MKKILTIISVVSFLLIGCNKNEEVALEPIKYRLISFSYEKDTGNNTSLMVMSIEFINPNNFGIKGIYNIELKRDNTSFYLGGENSGLPSQVINANDKIIVDVRMEDSYQANVTPAETMSFEDASYIVTEFPL